MFLPSKDIVGYISSMPIYFDCHVILQQNEEYHYPQFLLGKNVHASDYDPVVETYLIDFKTIRIMSEVMVDYVSVSLLLFFCVFFVVVFLLLLLFFVVFFHFRIVHPNIRERILLQLFMYMREKMRSLSLILKIVSACNFYIWCDASRYTLPQGH